jgi:hypothetical protein
VIEVTEQRASTIENLTGTRVDPKPISNVMLDHSGEPYRPERTGTAAVRC